MPETRADMLERIDKADKAWYDRYQREKRAESTQDTINHIQRAGHEGWREDGHAPDRSPARVSYVFTCRNCGHKLDRACPSASHEYRSGLTGEMVREEPFDCPSCSSSPWSRGEPVGLVVGRTFSPYWDVSGGANWNRPPGCVYVKGQGTYIPSKSHLREFARMNGREIR